MDHLTALHRRPIRALMLPHTSPGARTSTPDAKACRITILSMGCAPHRGIFLPPVTSALLRTAAVPRPRRSCLRNVVLGICVPGALWGLAGLWPAFSVPLFPGPQFDVGLNPRAVAAGDFDQDG